MYSNTPFASWVSKPVLIVLNFFIVFAFLSVSGVYSGTSSNLAGALNIYGEFLGMAKNASTIGMSTSIFLLVRLKSRFRTKELMVASAILLSALLYIIGTTQNSYMIVFGSFMIGFLRMFPMMEMSTPLMMVIAKGNKGIFYSIFYPLAIGFSQIYSYYFCKLVASSDYQSIYFLMSGVMLVVALLCLIFQHNQRFCRKTPLYQIDWLSIGMFATSAMCFNYVFTFMKQQDWLTSPYIVGSFFVGVLLLVITIYRQPYVKRRLFYFDVFYKYENVRHAILLFLFFGIFMSITSAYSQYISRVLGYSEEIIGRLNLWMIPGLIIAGIAGYISFKYQWKIKYLIILGFISMFLQALSFYFLIQPQMDIDYLRYPMIFKGIGMASLFMSIWFYASSNVPRNVMMGVMSIMILFRSFLSIAIGGAILGWASNQSQWQSLNDMAASLDWGDTMIGATNIQSININAIMSSSKIVLGTVCWLIIPVLIVIFSHHYGVFNLRRWVILKNWVKGNAIKGYSFRFRS